MEDLVFHAGQGLSEVNFVQVLAPRMLLIHLRLCALGGIGRTQLRVNDHLIEHIVLQRSQRHGHGTLIGFAVTQAKGIDDCRLMRQTQL